MTPSPGSMQSGSHSTLIKHTGEDAGHHAHSDHFADGHWTCDANDSNSVWSAASYWVRRKRAAAATDLSS
jgi:hypothetical protein